MSEHHISTTRTARYFTLGEPLVSVREVWIVLHGYGQSAEHFLRAFRSLDDESRVIVAPEALSRYYREGMKDHVVASWMTRADRENEIADYIEYIDRVVSRVFESIERKSVKLVVLGFSQGAATASRWAAGGAFDVDFVFLWGGHVPPDLDLAADGAQLRNLHLVLGTSDEYRDTAAIDVERKRLDDAGVAFSTIEYDGTHRIEAEPLTRVAAAVAGTR